MTLGITFCLQLFVEGLTDEPMGKLCDGGQLAAVEDVYMTILMEFKVTELHEDAFACLSYNSRFAFNYKHYLNRKR